MSASTSNAVKGYELIEQLGEGAFGAVYRARQEAVDREVAVKVILPQYANQPEFIRRFETEAQLVARLEHLHIVPLYDYWRDPEGAYLVMRLLRGGSLAGMLEKDEQPDIETVVQVVAQVASALDAAHAQGIVHRDLKPANILLDEAGNAYLSDFGIAKELGADAGQTQSGVMVGTPAYISPEQVQAEAVSPQTDIYSLGVLVYELLVGDHPFPDSSNAELMIKHLQEPLPYVREKRPELPAAVDGVIQRATAKRAAERYPDAASLAEDLRRALQLEAAEPEPAADALVNPYKGLRAFQTADAGDFFGRSALTGQLLAKMAVGSRFLAVVGPSGSGKSSVVKAGLVPALRSGALPGSSKWYMTEMHPGRQPLKELETALLRMAADADLDLKAALNKGREGLLEAAALVLPKGGELLLVVDQFEEVFSLVREEGEQARFLELVQNSVEAEGSRVRVVLTLRADFYDRPLSRPGFGPLVEAHTVVALPLTSEELAEAIRRPAERAGAVLEKGLVTAITGDVADQPGALPLLQYALTELFEAREGRMLTNAAYREIGGVLGALGRRAEEVYDGLDADGRRAARQLFLRLVTLGESAEDTRRRVERAELETLSPSMRLVIELYGRARLLSFDHDPATRAPTVEVAHEALLSEWKRLRDWLDESRADLRMERVLDNAAGEWAASGKEASFQLRGARLSQFEAWVQTTDLALTPLEQDYLEASLAERKAREEREAERQARARELEARARRFLRGLVVVLALAAAVATGLSIFAFNQQGIARENAAVALTEANARATQQSIAESEAAARALAEQDALAQRDLAVEEADARAIAEADAIAQRDLALESEQEALRQASIGLASQAILEMEGQNPELAALLALEAVQNYPYTWQAENALSRVAFRQQFRFVQYHPALGITGLDLSPDGSWAMSVNRYGQFRIWDTNSGETLRVFDTPGTETPDDDPDTLCTGAARGYLSPDGRWIMSIGWTPECIPDENIQIYDAASGTLLRSFSSQAEMNQFALTAPWSPDGSHFVTAHVDGKARIWEMVSVERCRQGGAGCWHYTSGLFASTVAEEMIVRKLDACPGLVLEAAWSPDGSRILTTCIDFENNTSFAALWDAYSGEKISEIVGWGGFDENGLLMMVNHASWSADGHFYSLVDRADGAVMVFDSEIGEVVQRILITADFTRSASLSLSGDRIITTGPGGVARLWDVRTGRMLATLNTESDSKPISWSPDNRLAAVSSTQQVLIWDTVLGRVVETLPGNGYIEWSQDGRRIFVQCDQAVCAYDLDSSLAVMRGPDGEPGGARSAFQPAWSPDGTRFARGFPDGSVVIWDTDTMEVLMTLEDSSGWAGGVSWSPDGERLFAGSSAGPARIWDARTGELLVELVDDRPDVFTITEVDPENPWGDEVIPTGTWSPDGSLIVTNSGGLIKVILWDAVTGEMLMDFTGVEDNRAGWYSAWSPDGTMVATANVIHRAILWDPATGEVLLDLFPEDYEREVSGVGWSHTGDRVAFFSRGYGYVFDTKTGETVLKMIGFPDETMNSILWTPDDRQIYTCGDSGSVRAYRVGTGEQIRQYDIGGALACDLSPDGTKLLVSSTDGTTRIYEVWETIEDLVAYAEDCCIFREMTIEERVTFGLPGSEDQ